MKPKLKTNLLVGGYYAIDKASVQLPFHLIGLNTNIYYKSNDLVGPDEKDPLGQLAWLKEHLTLYKSRGEKAFIFAHICPGKFERYYQPPGFHWFRPDFNDIFIDEIIIPFKDTIIAQVGGPSIHHSRLAE